MLHISGKYVFHITAVWGRMIRLLHVTGVPLHFIQKLIFDDFVFPALRFTERCYSECIVDMRFHSSWYGETLAWFRELQTGN
jgi:hypothetical protein